MIVEIKISTDLQITGLVYLEGTTLCSSYFFQLLNEERKKRK